MHIQLFFKQQITSLIQPLLKSDGAGLVAAAKSAPLSTEI